MKINPFIDLNRNDLILGPYRDGLDNFQKAFSVKGSNRWIHGAAGIALILPIVNIVVSIALRHFATTSILSQPQPPVVPLPTTAPTRRQGFSGAGVLPYATLNGRLHYLISQERWGVDAGTWCDFGGKKDPGENPVQTAARECWEESRGILGSKEQIEQNIRGTRSIGHHYRLYLMKVDHPEQITDATFQAAAAASHHQMEKVKIAWVAADDLDQYPLRPFFAAILNPRQQAA